MATPQKFTPVQDMPPKGGYPPVSYPKRPLFLLVLLLMREKRRLDKRTHCRWT
jgi:hypothetical protein